MKFLKELAKLTRIEHGIMFAIAVFIGEAIAGMIPAAHVLALSLLIPLFSEMGAFALNDYFDIEADKANKRKDRPLVAGTISPQFALWFSAASILLSIVFAYFISMDILLLTLALNLLAIAYNAKLKELPLVGNAYIAFTMGIPFIFGNIVVSPALFMPNVILFALGFVAGLAREIIKSIEDMEGDKAARKARTLPLVVGEKPALAAALLLYAAFIPLAYLPFVYGLKGLPLAYALVTLGNLLIIANMFYAFRGGYRKSRNLTLAAFFAGLVGYLLSTNLLTVGL